MRKHLLLFVIIIFILLAFGYKALQIKPVQNSPIDEKMLLTNLETFLNINSEIQSYRYSDWFNNDGIRLPLIGQNFWAGSSNMENPTLSKKMQDNLYLINSSFLAPIASTTGSFFMENGFLPNPQNTFYFSKDTMVQRRIGFENGNMKCIVTLYDTTDPFGSFSCGIIDTKQLELQKDFIPVFGNTLKEADPVSFRVDKIEGEFSRGTASDPILGYTWIAKKTDGNWKVIWKANEIGLCSDMKKLEIPKSIYDSCYAPEK